jgi:hypothetical protein
MSIAPTQTRLHWKAQRQTCRKKSFGYEDIKGLGVKCGRHVWLLGELALEV